MNSSCWETLDNKGTAELNHPTYFRMSCLRNGSGKMFCPGGKVVLCSYRKQKAMDSFKMNKDQIWPDLTRRPPKEIHCRFYIYRGIQERLQVCGGTRARARARLCVGVCGRARARACLWRSKHSLLGSVLAFHHVSSGKQTLIARLGSDSLPVGPSLVWPSDFALY